MNLLSVPYTDQVFSRFITSSVFCQPHIFNFALNDTWDLSANQNLRVIYQYHSCLFDSGWPFHTCCLPFCLYLILQSFIFRFWTSLVEIVSLVVTMGHFGFRGAVLACALPWLKSLLLQHASGIMSQESSLSALNTLYQVRDGISHYTGVGLMIIWDCSFTTLAVNHLIHIHFPFVYPYK